MGDLSDRRAQQKARTREHVRTVAQRLFTERGFDAVTIADIARSADVAVQTVFNAVQTVFNHFPTKEELFFDGRTPWVAGPADTVRSREPGELPLDALRRYLVDLVHGRLSGLACSERRAYIRTLEASETLPVRERELVFESERRLAEALREAWTSPDAGLAGPVPHDPGTTATVTAAMWLSAVRALVVGYRTAVTGDPDARAVADQISDLADRLLSGLAAEPAGHGAVRRAG